MKEGIKLLAALLVLALVSCQQSSGIVGQITDANNMTIYFDQISLDNTTQSLDQTTSDASGNFNLTIPEGLSKGMYRVRIGAKSIELLLDGSEKSIKINGSLQGLDKFEHTVEGSQLTQQYLDPMKKFVSKEWNVQQLTEYIKGDSEALPATHLAMKVFQARTAYLDVHKAVLEKVNKSDLVGTPIAITYGSTVSQLDAQKRREDALKKIQVGQPAPEIALNNPDGKVMKLSDLKGQVVLIDFWASWCGPCRKANPHVVEMYDKYKKDGFTVFSVSLDGMDSRTKKRYNGDESQIKMQLDRSKEKWLAAIKQDNLKWDYHVSDLKKWESEAAAEYGVRSIPQTFLVGKDGLIAAVNPRYDLEQQIQKNI